MKVGKIKAQLAAALKALESYPDDVELEVAVPGYDEPQEIDGLIIEVDHSNKCIDISWEEV